MISVIDTGTVVPFESAGELHQAHERLLEALDNELGSRPTPTSETEALKRLNAQMRKFVECGAATGAFIEEINERTACQTLVDYWASNLARSGTDIGRVRLVPFDSARLPELPNEPCPYVGLETFKEANQSIFFGREEAIEKVLAHLRVAPLVVVAGASGSGKSSLVLGGVLPRLEKQDGIPRLHIVAPFSPGTDVLAHLANSVRHDSGVGGGVIAADVGALRRHRDHLHTMVGGDGAPPTLITIDQFEEVFTLCGEKDRTALIANLARLLEGERRHRAILTIREEFEGRMKELVLPLFQCRRAWYSIPEMDYEELRAAILKPAEAVNLHFKTDVVEHLVRRVIHQPAALPLLQFTLRRLWDVRDHNRITQEVYDKIGADPLRALATSAKAFLDDHKDPQTLDEIKRILLELVRVDERLEAYRQPVARSRLLAAGKANTGAVLGLLEAADFVRITPQLGETDAVVEVKHESLVRNWPDLVEWIGEKRDRYRQRLGLTEAAASWNRKGKPADEGLITGSLLADAAREPDLSHLEREYIRASENSVDKARRELARTNEMLARHYSIAKYATIAAIVLLCCALIATGLWIHQRRRVEMSAWNLRNTQAANLSDVGVDLLNGVEMARRSETDEDIFRNLIGPLTRNLSVAHVFSSHVSRVRTVKFSPNGRILASGSEDGTISLRDMSTGRLLHAPWHAHNGAVYSLAFDSSGYKVASAGDDSTVRLWDIVTGKLERPFSLDSKGGVSVAFAPVGNLLAAACKDGTVVIWDLAQETRKTLVSNDAAGGKDSANHPIAFTSDGSLLASGAEDGRIILWDVGTGTPKGPPIEAHDPVYSLAIQGNLIASGHKDGSIHLWNVNTRDLVNSPTPHLHAVYGVSFSPDIPVLVTTSVDGRAELHVVEKETARGRIGLRTSTLRLSGVNGRFYSVDFTKNGVLAAGTENGTVVHWDLRSPPRLAQRVRTGKEEIRTTFTGDGQMLILWAGDSLTFRVVNADPTRPEAQGVVNAGQNGVDFAFALEGKDLLTIGKDNSIKRWRWDTTKHQYKDEMVAPPREDRITAASYAGEANTLVFSTESARHDAKLWRVDMTEGKSRPIFNPAADFTVISLAVSPRADLIAISMRSEENERTIVKSLKPGGKVYPLPLSFSLAFSPDGKRLAYTDRVGRIFLRDVEALDQEPITLDNHMDTVESLSFSRDGSRLASISLDKTVVLWDVSTGQPMTAPMDINFKGPVKTVQVSLSPDDQFLAATSFGGDENPDGEVILWNMSPKIMMYVACQITGRNMSRTEWKGYFGSKEPYRITCPSSTADEADVHALAGDTKAAKDQFAEAWSAELQMGDLGQAPELANHICWLGSTSGFAATVKASCEKAVEWADPAEKDLSRDSRGLARAMIGDTKGAIADFESVVAYLNKLPDRGGYSKTFVHRREAWIRALRMGKSPFDTKLLETLRIEDPFAEDDKKP